MVSEVGATQSGGFAQFPRVESMLAYGYTLKLQWLGIGGIAGHFAG